MNSDTGRKHNTLSLRCANARLEQAGHYNRKEKTCAPFLSDDYKVAFFLIEEKIQKGLNYSTRNLIPTCEYSVWRCLECKEICLTYS